MSKHMTKQTLFLHAVDLKKKIAIMDTAESMGMKHPLPKHIQEAYKNLKFAEPPVDFVDLWIPEDMKPLYLGENSKDLPELYEICKLIDDGTVKLPHK